MATLPWGDISTAYTSTQIPNIEVYMGVPSMLPRIMKLQRLFNPVLRSKFIKKLGQRWIDKNLFGPSDKENQSGQSLLHGVVRNGADTASAILSCAGGYKLTALCTLNIAQKVLQDNFSAGYQTPASAYGWRLILEIPGTEMEDLV